MQNLGVGRKIITQNLGPEVGVILLGDRGRGGPFLATHPVGRAEGGRRQSFLSIVREEHMSHNQQLQSTSTVGEIQSQSRVSGSQRSSHRHANLKMIRFR